MLCVAAKIQRVLPRFCGSERLEGGLQQKGVAMLPRLRLFAVVCVGLLFAFTSQAIGEHPSPKDGAPKKCDELVRALVSPNEKPITHTGAENSVKFPADYNAKMQKRIEAARQSLHDNFEQALPYLVDALDDNRYCMTIDWADGDAYYNYSVGQVCRDVIASQLEVYRNEIRFLGPPHWHRYDYGPINKKWWHARKGRSLAELQIEAIDWAIKQRKAEPKDEVCEERANEILNLQKLRNKIAKSKKPVKSLRMLPMVTSDR